MAFNFKFHPKTSTAELKAELKNKTEKEKATKNRGPKIAKGKGKNSDDVVNFESISHAKAIQQISLS